MTVLVNKETNKIKKIHFGSSKNFQYKDNTGLDLYTHLNNYDLKRRAN